MIIMQTHGLTEKNMTNKRFRQTEHDIFIAYYKLKNHSDTKSLAHHAGISRSTLYRHHQKSQNIPDDYEDYLLLTYNRLIQDCLRSKTTSLSNIYLRTLVFISNHKEVFVALFSDGHQGIIKKMLANLGPKITAFLCLDSKMSTAYIVYENEILGVIEVWSKHNFSSTKLDKTLKDILYLTSTAPERLAPLK